MLDSHQYSPAIAGLQATPAALAPRGPYDQVVEPYTAAGLTLVPCDGKRPCCGEGWEKLTPEGSLRLGREHGHRNVGVLGGEPSGVVFLDDDTGDPEVDALIERLFPSPWRR